MSTSYFSIYSPLLEEEFFREKSLDRIHKGLCPYDGTAVDGKHFVLVGRHDTSQTDVSSFSPLHFTITKKYFIQAAYVSVSEQKFMKVRKLQMWMKWLTISSIGMFVLFGLLIWLSTTDYGKQGTTLHSVINILSIGNLYLLFPALIWIAIRKNIHARVEQKLSGTIIMPSYRAKVFGIPRYDGRKHKVFLKSDNISGAI
jgi:hypothetical protein